MKFATKAIHAGQHPDPATGAVMTPIYQTSTYAQAAPGDHKGYEYSRTHNPTRDALQRNIAALENGKFGFCFASGMAATDTLLRLLKPGDEIISTNDLYGGTYRLFTKVYEHWGIKSNFINLSTGQDLASHISAKTKLIWVETPTNPMMQIIDIQKVVKIARQNNIWVVVDNTFATPYLQNPLDLGADIVVHSATKYLAGHSDVVMGAVVVNEERLAEQIAFLQNSAGAVPGPQDCFLALRGLKTLPIRMKQHCENASFIAQHLASHAKVDQVYWPGLPTHANHSVAASQMNDFGGMLSFTLKDDQIQTTFEVLKRFKYFILAESLGGVESLCGHPASMTHASIPKQERLKAGLKDSLIRLSVGIEDKEDLLDDIMQALG